MEEEGMKRSAVALLSGGLDSMLAVKMMVEQGVELTAVHFTSPFCNCSSRNTGCGNQARRAAETFGVPIRVVAKGMDYLRVVEKAPHGYGRGMNPCIDCRIYMLRKVSGITTVEFNHCSLATKSRQHCRKFVGLSLRVWILLLTVKDDKSPTPFLQQQYLLVQICRPECANGAWA